MLVTIAAQTNNDWSLDPSIPVELRIFALQAYVAEDGTPVSQSPARPAVNTRLNWSVSAPCTVTATVAGKPSAIALPALTVESTTDALANQNAQLSAYLFRTDTGAALGPFSYFSAFILPGTVASITWGELAAAQGVGFISGSGNTGTLGTFTAETSVKVGAQTLLVDTPGSAFVDATIDSEGKVSEGTLATGQKVFYGGLAVQNGLLVDALQATEAEIGGAIQAAMPSNSYGLVDAVTDSNGNVAWGIKADGSVIIGGNLTVEGSVTEGSTALGSATLPPEDLTPSSAAESTLTLAGLNVFLIIGQSLSNGFLSTPVITTAQLYNNVMLAGGVREGMDASTIAASSLASLVPLVEQQISGPYGETLGGGTTDFLSSEFLKRGVTVPNCVVQSGDDGTQYSLMAKGTTTYNNSLQCMTAIKSLATNPHCRGLLILHGENDEYIQNTSYEADLQTWRSNYSADINTALGTSDTLLAYVMQCQTWGVVGEGSHTTPTVAPQQLSVCEDNPTLFRFVCPQYFLDHAQGTNAQGGNLLHLTGPSERILAEYCGKAILQDLLAPDTQPWTGLRPKKITRAGRTIIVAFYVPVSPLVLDTTTVTPPTANPNGLLGFEFSDGTNTPPAISAVTVVGADSVMIQLSALPTTGSMFLSYAYTANPGEGSGPNIGPRGCLRDSDTTPLRYNGQPMYNWCGTFHKAVL